MLEFFVDLDTRFFPITDDDRERAFDAYSQFEESMLSAKLEAYGEAALSDEQQLRLLSEGVQGVYTTLTAGDLLTIDGEGGSGWGENSPPRARRPSEAPPPEGPGPGASLSSEQPLSPII